MWYNYSITIRCLFFKMCTQSYSHSKFKMSLKPVHDNAVEHNGYVCELMKQGWHGGNRFPYRDRREISNLYLGYIWWNLINNLICLNSSSSYTTTSGINLCLVGSLFNYTSDSSSMGSHSLEMAVKSSKCFYSRNLINEIFNCLWNELLGEKQLKEI